MTTFSVGKGCSVYEPKLLHESRFAAAVQAVNNENRAQVRKDAPSLIDVNGLGRPKEFSGKEEDFQQWLKKN